MIITNRKTLFQIQQDFQKYFPYLKIEFYDAAHTAGEGSPPFQQISDYSKSIGAIRKVHKIQDFSINGNQKVSTLERNFYEQFGLNVQVFRMSRGIWIQTITTDHWTLSQQNEKAKQYALA